MGFPPTPDSVIPAKAGTHPFPHSPYTHIYGASVPRLASHALGDYNAALFGAGLAQLVVHLICNQRVGGSSPSAGTNLDTEAAKPLRYRD